MFVQGHAHRVKFVVDWGRGRSLEKTNLPEAKNEINDLAISILTFIGSSLYFYCHRNLIFVSTTCIEHSVVHQGSSSLHL